jgi:plastocyanin
MANPTTHGTAHVFGIVAGIAAVADATVQAFSLTIDEQNKTSTKNELGNEIERRRDDTISEGSITLRFESGYVELAPGDVITYPHTTGTKYEVDTVGRTETNEAHVTVEYTIKTTANVTLA